MSAKVSTVEAVVARLATSQHGLVTRAQLLDAGLTRHQIQHRLLLGALLCVYRPVYRVGHRAPRVEARYLAAVLAGGDRARLSGRAAAHLLGLLRGRAPAPEVTAPEPAPAAPAPEPEQQPAAPSAAPVQEGQIAQQLPRSASPLPLAGLMGLLSIAAGAGVRMLRRRA